MSIPWATSGFIWTGNSINSSSTFPFYGFVSGPIITASSIFAGSSSYTSSYVTVYVTVGTVSTFGGFGGDFNGIPFSSFPRQPEPKIPCVRRSQCKNQHCGGCAGYEPEPEPVSEKINKRIKGVVDRLDK